MQIDIPEKLFERLQKHATPLIDTPISVIGKLTDFYEQHNGGGRHSNPIKSNSVILAGEQTSQNLDPQNPPSLLHSKARGEFATIPFSNWNDLLRIAHIETFKKEKSFERLRQATSAQISPGVRSDSGFKYISEIGISLQGVDAPRAWKHALRLAKHLNVPIKAWVEWQHKDEAAFPGERASLKWNP